MQQGIVFSFHQRKKKCFFLKISNQVGFFFSGTKQGEKKGGKETKEKQRAFLGPILGHAIVGWRAQKQDFSFMFLKRGVLRFSSFFMMLISSFEFWRKMKEMEHVWEQKELQIKKEVNTTCHTWDPTSPV